jgi:lysophospholipase L1-like esterase
MSRKYYFILIIAIFLTACGGTTQQPVETQPSPSHTKLVAKAEANEYSVEPDKEVILSAKNSVVSETETIEYLWITKDGEVLGREPILHWKAPEEEGDYEIILVLNFQKEDESISKVTITVTKPPLVLENNDSTFSTIQKMIELSKEGTLANVTYICVGDSTRALTTTPDGLINHSDNIFKDIDAQLHNYNVTGYLDSQGGLTFKAYLGRGTYLEDGRTWINIQKTIDKIPADGYTTIVDISLGVNDLSGLDQLYTKDEYPSYYENDYYFFRDTIKSLLLETIHRIQEKKPKVKIMLTSPNPMRYWKNGSGIYQRVYKEVAQEEKIPLANFVDEIMPAAGTTEFENWYLDNIHFNRSVGLPKVSNFILGKILPTN